MMKKIKKSKLLGIFTAVLLFIAYGCSDEFLIDEKTDGISGGTVYLSDLTASATVTGIYDAFQAAPSEYITKSIFEMNQLTQDWNGDNASGIADLQEFNIDENNQIVGKMWGTNYSGIGRANIALYNLQPAIDAGSISADLGSRLIGEALVLRGIFYHYLAAAMGGVPLVIEPTTDDFFAPRNTQDEVFQQIVSDMENAVARLPWSYADEKGRVTKGTAYALLGSAHMWLGQYTQAVAAFEELEGHFFLEDDYLDVHAMINKNGKESIFELQMSDDTGTDLNWNRNDDTNYLQSFCMPAEIAGGSYGGLPTAALYNSFEAGDLRRQATVIAPGEEHPDPLISIIDYPNVDINTIGTVASPWFGTGAGNPSQGRSGYYGIKTWRNPVVDGWNGTNIFSGQNRIWMRYGEMLLSLAEAQLKSGQGDPMATVMRVRNRAWGGSAPTPTGDMLDIIIKEYRHELGGEFSLWPVMRRVGNESAIEAAFGITIDSGEKNMLLPIPRIERDRNPNLDQNPGYAGS